MAKLRSYASFASYGPIFFQRTWGSYASYKSYASYGSDILSERPSYGVTLISQVTGNKNSGEVRVDTEVT